LRNGHEESEAEFQDIKEEEPYNSFEKTDVSEANQKPYNLREKVQNEISSLLSGLYSDERIELLAKNPISFKKLTTDFEFFIKFSPKGGHADEINFRRDEASSILKKINNLEVEAQKIDPSKSSFFWHLELRNLLNSRDSYEEFLPYLDKVQI
jgi:hypothetical protein